MIPVRDSRKRYYELMRMRKNCIIDILISGLLFKVAEVLYSFFKVNDNYFLLSIPCILLILGLYKLITNLKFLFQIQQELSGKGKFKDR